MTTSLDAARTTHYTNLNAPIFARAEEAVRAWLTLDRHHGVIVSVRTHACSLQHSPRRSERRNVRKQRAVAVAEFETPHLHVLVGAARHQQRAVTRRILRTQREQRPHITRAPADVIPTTCTAADARTATERT
jgi:hypothetical protein